MAGTRELKHTDDLTESMTETFGLSQLVYVPSMYLTNLGEKDVTGP